MPSCLCSWDCYIFFFRCIGLQFLIAQVVLQAVLIDRLQSCGLQQPWASHRLCWQRLLLPHEGMTMTQGGAICVPSRGNSAVAVGHCGERRLQQVPLPAKG